MEWSGWSVFACEPRDASLRPLGEGRPPGLHLGAVLHRMKVAAGDRVGDVEGDQPYLRMQEGFLFESALEYVAAGMGLDEALEVAFKRYMIAIRSGITRQVAVERDGIHMTPDALDPERGLIESYKVTRRTLRNARTQSDFEAYFWAWMVQEKSYALACGVDTCRWIVLWQAGDYSRGVGSGPQMLECTATWTPEELMANWQTVLMHAEGLR
jgi:hypothetical protein